MAIEATADIAVFINLFPFRCSTLNSEANPTGLLFPIVVWSFPYKMHPRDWSISTSFPKTPESPKNLAKSKVFEGGSILTHLEFWDHILEVGFVFLRHLYV